MFLSGLDRLTFGDLAALLPLTIKGFILVEVAVIGAGVVGAVTADVLVENGLQVTIYETASQPATLASRSNGGQLSYSFTDAMPSPALLGKIPQALTGADIGLQVGLRPNLEFLQWGMRFIQQCTRKRHIQNSDALFSMAMSSIERMNSYAQRFGDQYAAKKVGKLVLMDQAPSSLEQQRLSTKRNQGCEMHVLQQEELLAVEPTLGAWRERPKYGVYSPSDEVGDAHLFAQILLRQLAAVGTELNFESAVTGIKPMAGGGWQVESEGVSRSYDAVVLCTGLAPKRLLSNYGIRLPIFPVAGYSVTLPMTQQSASVSLTALKQKLVFSRLGDRIRIAGFADINGAKAREGRRQRQLLQVAQQLAPNAAQYDAADANFWTGFRPMTPTNVPIVGAAKMPGLFYNLGHGMLGWTLAAGSARVVADEIVSHRATCSAVVTAPKFAAKGAS